MFIYVQGEVCFTSGEILSVTGEDPGLVGGVEEMKVMVVYLVSDSVRPIWKLLTPHIRESMDT